jgi:hypothetical protein
VCIRKENGPQSPIVAKGIIAYWLFSGIRRPLDLVYYEYYIGLRYEYTKIKEREADAGERDLNAEFYVKHIPEEKECIEQPEALYTYLTKEQKEYMKPCIDNYFDYIQTLNKRETEKEIQRSVESALLQPMIENLTARIANLSIEGIYKDGNYIFELGRGILSSSRCMDLKG